MGEFSNPERYEVWMGRWSARLAPAFVAFAGLPEGGRFLDVGSGTGVLAEALLAELEPASIVGIEPAEAYVEYTRGRVCDRRVSFQGGDALDIPFADDEFDATLSLLILQELPDAAHRQYKPPFRRPAVSSLTGVGTCGRGSRRLVNRL